MDRNTYCPLAASAERRPILWLLIAALCLGSVTAASSVLPRKASASCIFAAAAQLRQETCCCPSTGFLPLFWDNAA